jgi:hypothetical protein
MEFTDNFRNTKPTQELINLFVEYQDKIDNESKLNYFSDDITNDQLIKLLKEAIKTGKKISGV